MKNYICILILVSLIAGCSQYEKKTEDNDIMPSVSGSDSVHNNQEKLIYNVTMDEKQYDLSMYNEKYLLRLIPDSVISRGDMVYHVLLTKRSDTIINYPINIDTIESRYYEINKTGLEDERIEFKKDYYLSRLKHTFIRTDNLYLDAILNSKSDTTKMRVILKFKYRGKKKGKLYINVL